MAFGLISRVRWRQVDDRDLDEVVRRLESWPCPAGGRVRHMFPLATIEARGADVVRVAEDGDAASAPSHVGGWAACIVLPRRLFVPCGDPGVIREAGTPERRWRLVVGDAAACEALMEHWGGDPRAVVHVQRFQAVDASRVPDERHVADPGLRRAQPADVGGLAALAVQLHLDDDYGPAPGRSARRAYRERMQRSVERGSVWCVGKVGRPLVKVEFAVDSDRYGVQLSGICVQPERRGRGLGLAAVAAAVRRALARHPDRPVALHVRADNEAALRTYERAGFVDREEWRLAVHP